MPPVPVLFDERKSPRTAGSFSVEYRFSKAAAVSSRR